MANSPIVTAYAELPESEHPVYHPSEPTQKLISYVTAQHARTEETKRYDVSRAWQGQAFLQGHQHAVWEPINGALIEPSADDGDVLDVRNYFRHIIEGMTAKLTENRPDVEVVPATSQEEDADKARCSTQLLDHIWNKLNLDSTITSFVKTLLVQPIGFLMTEWDVTAGEEYTVEPDSVEAKVLTAEGGEDPEAIQGELQAATLKSGFPTVVCYGITNVGVDPGCIKPDLSDARWCYTVSRRHIDEVKLAYPETGKYVSPSSTFKTSPIYTLQAQIAGRPFDDKGPEEYVDVIAYYEKSSPRHEKGFEAVVCGGVLLDYLDELPYNELPLVAGRHNSVPGQLIADGAAADLMPMQRNLNKASSAILRQADLMANNVWLIADGSVTTEITARDGLVIRYDPSKPAPRQAPAAPLSPVHGQIMQDQTAAMKEISGATDVMLGASPDISGRAIGLLSDRDSTLLSATVKELERVIVSMAQKLLRLWRDRMPIPVTLRVTGPDGINEVREFHREDINSLDVRIIPNSSLPKYPSYRREQIKGFFASGIMGPVNDPMTAAKARKLLEFGDMDKVFGDKSRDRKCAKDENILIRQGGHPKPTGLDDHVTHIDTHLDFFYTEEFRAVLLPEEQFALMWHAAWHYLFLAAEKANIPWYSPRLQVKDYPEMPPDDVVPVTAQGPAGLLPAQPPQEDAYSLTPGMNTQPIQQPPPVGTLTPEQQMQYEQAMQQYLLAQQEGAQPIAPPPIDQGGM